MKCWVGPAANLQLIDVGILPKFVNIPTRIPNFGTEIIKYLECHQ